MKKRFIIISTILVVIILGVALTFLLLNVDKSKKKDLSNNKTSITKIEDNFKENETTTITTEKLETSSESTTINSTTTTKKNNIKNSTTKNENKTTNKEVIEQTQENTTSKNDKPWDKFGVTEDDYYNKPAYKWEKVDFSIEKYGTESKTRKACLAYGDNYEPYLNGEVSFNCDSVFSLSGKYLGEMFHTEKLN